MTSEQIHTAPSLPPEFQQAAQPAAPVIEPPKVMISLAIDADVLKWYQGEGEPKDWQGRFNDLLRSHMDYCTYRDEAWAMEDQNQPEPAAPFG